MKTLDLIDRLVGSARPVRRLQPPAVRAAWWLLAAAAVLTLLAVGHGVRPDLPARLQQAGFVSAITSALATAVLAAIAAFQLSLPDRSRRWVLLPVPALALWLSTVGYGCLP